MSYKKGKNSTDVEPVEYPFLTQIASPQAEHKIDLVFVHGLNPFGRDDHPTKTWTHENGNFWPRDLLADDLPYARIFIFGYNSNVTKGSTMSVVGISDHAETLLNLLDMKREQLGQTLSKIIFVGHSLGGLVIKQALVFAQQNAMYKAIQTATFGLVFFGCPHHGAKGIELGKIAAGVAKFVSEGRATNDLLDSLEHNSLFTRDVSQQFRHQLEDYQVVSFIEGMAMQLIGYGPMSVSKIVVEKESAVLGLAGSREVQVVVGADHSAMCKIKDRSARYDQIQGNIKRLVNKAVASIQGYVPPPTHYSSSFSSFPAPPPLPTRPPSHASSSYAPPPPSGTIATVTGSLYYPTGTDPKSTRLAALKNEGHWNQAKQLEYDIFQDKMKELGPDHFNTLSTGYDLARTNLELGLAKEASEWVGWVISANKPTLDQEHNILSMKVKSLQGEILQFQGDNAGSETVCTTVLTNQQDSLSEDSLDILETQRRIANVCNALGRREEAISRLGKRVQTLEKVVGGSHILSIVAMLDLIEVSTSHHLADQFGIARLNKDVQSAARILSETYTNLKSALGPRNPVSIRTLLIYGRTKIMQGESTEASDLLRRALSYAEEILGVDHPLTIDIVFAIGLVYMKSQGLSYVSNGPPEMRPWFQRTLEWLDKRKGVKHGETRMILQILGQSYMGAKDYLKAEPYYERLSISYGADSSKEAQIANSMLGLCQMNTVYLRKREQKNSGSLASMFPGLGLR